MRILAALTIVLALTSCKKNDKFIQEYKPYNEPRYSKDFKLDTATSETYAVEVDILWVIDNSGSMDPYQQKVIQNSAQFIQQFASSSRLQWRMGLISTDENEPPYMGFTSTVDWLTAAAVQIFNNSVARLGTWGSGIEMAYTPVINALNKYPNFLRPDSYFITIFVSDELEQSWRHDTNQYLDVINAKLKGNIGKYVAYGVYGPDSNDKSNQRYNEIVQRTGGKKYSLTAPDFGVLLSDLGKDLVTRVTVVNPIVLLDQKPIVETIQVMYKGRVLAPGQEWIYNSQHNFVELRAPLDNRALDVNISFQVDRS